MATVFSPQVFPNDSGILINPYTLKDTSRNEMHYHDCAEIGLCTNGSGVCFVEDKTVPFIQGQITFVCANESHIFQSHPSSPSTWIFLYLSPELTKSICLPESGVYKNGNVETLILILFNLAEKPDTTSASKFHLACATTEILCGCESAISTGTNDPNRKRILPALEYISYHYQEQIGIQTLAGLCYLSESFFRRCFRETIHDTPHAYLNRVRLAFAESLLLSTDTPILEISQASGFESLSSFNRTFRKYHDMPPREYRAINSLPVNQIK